jgi:hypothetical protein
VAYDRRSKFTYLLVDRETNPLRLDTRVDQPRFDDINCGLRRREEIDDLLRRHMLAKVLGTGGRAVGRV